MKNTKKIRLKKSFLEKLSTVQIPVNNDFVQFPLPAIWNSTFYLFIPIMLAIANNIPNLFVINCNKLQRAPNPLNYRIRLASVQLILRCVYAHGR